MEEITALRQRLAAAESLVTSLRERLVRAEVQFAAVPQPSERCGASSSRSSDRAATPGAISLSNLDPSLQQVLASAPPLNNHRRHPREAALPGSADETPAITAQSEDHIVPAVSPAPASHVGDTAEYPVPPDVALPSLTVKTAFPTLEAAKNAVLAHASVQGWTPATRERDRLRLLMGCRSTPDCPYHVRVETCAEGARISAYKSAHNCFGATNNASPPKRHHHSYLRFLKAEVPKLMELASTTSTREIQDVVYKHFGTRIRLSQCAKVRGPAGRPKRPFVFSCGKCGGSGHNRLTCTADQPGVEGRKHARLRCEDGKVAAQCLNAHRLTK